VQHYNTVIKAINSSADEILERDIALFCYHSLRLTPPTDGLQPLVRITENAKYDFSITESLSFQNLLLYS